jgi:uncharacterized protein (UPF0335 family)
MAAGAALTVRSPHSPPRLDRADAIVELCAGRVDPEETMSGPVGLAGDQLRAFVERIEHVEEEIKALTEDKKDIYAEAKGQGYDVKILREVVRVRKQDQKEQDENQSLLDSYLRAIATATPPLAKAA